MPEMPAQRRFRVCLVEANMELGSATALTSLPPPHSGQFSPPLLPLFKIPLASLLLVVVLAGAFICQERLG